MRKAWRNPRQIVVHQAPADLDDARRVTALVSLLAIGIERLLSRQDDDAPESVDFRADVSHVCAREKMEDRRSL